MSPAEVFAAPISPRVRAAALVIVDATAWSAGLVAAITTRYGFAMTRAQLEGALAVTVLAAGMHAAIGHLLYVYRGRCGFGSFEEVRPVTVTAMTVAGTLLLADLLLPTRPVPASAPIVGGAVALVAMLAARYLHRLRTESVGRRAVRAATPVLVFGAGATGRALIHTMLGDPRANYHPVGLIDDDPGKRHLKIHHVPVLGDRCAVPAAVRATGATAVVFAVSAAEGSLIREIGRIVAEAGVAFKVLPSVNELLDRSVDLAAIRDMDITDLLGRRQIETDISSVAGYLTGRRVLVTGAGGSIGAELCRQIHRFGPAELIMLDRDESALHAVQLSIHGRALLDSNDLVLADIRDAGRIGAIFAERRPDVVFHAAALKHLPLLERYPSEAVKSNVWGTLAVLDAAREHKVERFVNISTDKAANPRSVLGYSKRVAERLTAHTALTVDGTFLSVRFGNVLGSRGSVLTAFKAQVASGGPITVTHPDVTRYFMTVQEAVQLVVQAAALGRPGEALVLDMGSPVRIVEVARQLADQAPQPVGVVYTGLRDGEKLHEELFGFGETDRRPLHPLISHVEVPPLAPECVQSLQPWAGRPSVIEHLARLCQHEPRQQPQPARGIPIVPTRRRAHHLPVPEFPLAAQQDAFWATSPTHPGAAGGNSAETGIP